ncbi:MAG TPA: 50S ribosomal protein L11 methyltransferase [Deltaproteobacteria bacterium]|nr:50S ribosomal protein L11 methyltransferase [Deltaproteobacteria bacterium]
MNWVAAEVHFTSDNPEQTEDLVSNIFYEFGLQGVVVTEACVTGYFPLDERIDNQRHKLESALLKLKQEIKFDYQVDYSETTEEDWAESWKAFFKPERIGRRLVVKPTWELYESRPADVIIEIDPGMAFGTGTHPTTAMCLETIESYLKPGDSFLDLGTGSGILMIAAARLGAKRLVGIDKDPVAAEIAEKNMKRNDIPEEIYQVKTGNLTREIDERFDLIAANILTEVVLTLLDNLNEVVAENGTIILSGITESKRHMVHKKMAEKGILEVETRLRDSWAAIVGIIQS